MSAVKTVTIRCDGTNLAGNDANHQPAPVKLVRCDATFVGEESEPEELVVRRAAASGWKRYGGWDYCQRHIQQAGGW